MPHTSKSFETQIILNFFLKNNTVCEALNIMFHREQQSIEILQFYITWLCTKKNIGYYIYE